MNLAITVSSYILCPVCSQASNPTHTAHTIMYQTAHDISVDWASGLGPGISLDKALRKST